MLLVINRLYPGSLLLVYLFLYEKKLFDHQTLDKATCTVFYYSQITVFGIMAGVQTPLRMASAMMERQSNARNKRASSQILRAYDARIAALDAYLTKEEEDIRASCFKDVPEVFRRGEPRGPPEREEPPPQEEEDEGEFSPDEAETAEMDFSP